MAADDLDVVVVGAGPAGMAAALAASAQGAAVLLLDDAPAAGGQIYRGVGRADPKLLDTLGPDYAAGRSLTEALAKSGVQYRTGTAVWQVTREREVHFIEAEESRVVRARQVVLCTGALERPFPVPGWTLPGVMTAGAAQILLKSAQVVPAEAPVLAGCGPLLILLAWQYLRAGVRVAAIVESTRMEDYRRALPHLPGALRAWGDLRKGLAMLRDLRAAGIPFHRGARGLAIEGDKCAQAVTFDKGGQRMRVPARTVLLHQGVVPNTQITWSLRARHVWNDAQQCFQPVNGAWGELDIAGIRIAGDGAGIAGAAAAIASGTLAGIAAAHACGRVDAATRDLLAAPHRDALRRQLAIRPFLDALYRAPDVHRIPADDVLVCRCEEVGAGTLRAHVALGASGPNQAKAYGRCGMGPCQGRLCGLTVTEVIARATGRTPDEVGYYRIRAPIKPITLGQLAGIATGAPPPSQGPSAAPAPPQTRKVAPDN